jgi:2,3-dihydroxybenzoate decarboxylase
MWGFGAETGLHAMCLICSGVFDRYPGLKIILGHLGEALPFWLWRIDNHWIKMRDAGIAPNPVGGRVKKLPSQYLKENFLVTTSGMPSPPVLQFVHTVLGADRMLLSTDYPYEPAGMMIEAIDSLDISREDKEKIFHGNAEKALGL